jgi:hypothetical protein
MSGSPKYNSVALAAARRAQAEAERAERARRREQKRQRRLAQALQKTRAGVARRCASLAARHASLRGPAAAAGLGGEAATQEKTVAQVAADISGAADHPALAVASRRLDLLEQHIETLGDAVSLRQEAAASARLAQLSARLEAIPRGERLRVDASGSQAAEVAMGDAGPAGDSVSSESVDTAARKVAEHLQRIRQAQADRAARAREADARTDELEAKLDALEADGRDLGVEVDGAAFAREYLERMRRFAAEGRFDELSTLSVQVADAIGRTEQKFDDAVERIVERRRFMASIVAGLRDMEFDVIEGSLVEQADGSVSVRAQTAHGQAVDVLVQDGEATPHEVLYSSPELAAEENAGSVNGSTCGSVVELAEALNERAGRDGYLTGAVTWDDGGPGPDEGRTAVNLPSAAPRVRRAHG